ncbi:MAG: hypothetical protein OEZ10_07360 [Gammaproteobacteria bacterium]|nr:hypothetical protein [Gammaproteobacteria bacterium]
MTEPLILFVPGKHPKPPAAEHLALLRLAMAGGLRRIAATQANRLERCEQILEVAPWNFSYYAEHRDESRDWPWIELMLEREAASLPEKQQARHWRTRMAGIWIGLADRFPWLIRWIPDPVVRESVADTWRYFCNQNKIACRVREYVKAPLREAFAADREVLVIGHSMGSVIAYDALWELWHEEHNKGLVDFLTIGSPLGSHFVQCRLLGWENGHGRRYPGNIGHWTNIAAEGDLVSLDKTLADDFSGMIGQYVRGDIIDIYENVYTWFRNEDGLNVHRSYGYLVHPEVSRVIAAFLAR